MIRLSNRVALASLPSMDIRSLLSCQSCEKLEALVHLISVSKSRYQAVLLFSPVPTYASHVTPIRQKTFLFSAPLFTKNPISQLFSGWCIRHSHLDILRHVVAAPPDACDSGEILALASLSAALDSGPHGLAQQTDAKGTTIGDRLARTPSGRVAALLAAEQAEISRRATVTLLQEVYAQVPFA